MEQVTETSCCPGHPAKTSRSKLRGIRPKEIKTLYPTFSHRPKVLALFPPALSSLCSLWLNLNLKLPLGLLGDAVLLHFLDDPAEFVVVENVGDGIAHLLHRQV